MQNISENDRNHELRPPAQKAIIISLGRRFYNHHNLHNRLISYLFEKKIYTDIAPPFPRVPFICLKLPMCLSHYNCLNFIL